MNTGLVGLLISSWRIFSKLFSGRTHQEPGFIRSSRNVLIRSSQGDFHPWLWFEAIESWCFGVSKVRINRDYKIFFK
jgi:hypothetical protein